MIGSDRGKGAQAGRPYDRSFVAFPFHVRSFRPRCTMKLKLFSWLLLGSVWWMSGGMSVPAEGGMPKPGQATLAAALEPSGSDTALARDIGPEGIYVDTQGHDQNDDVVGSVTYNNQSRVSVHIQAIYVHGKNIKTQGLFPVNVDIEVGAKVKLLEVLRDKTGEPATVAVEVHYQ